MQSNQSGLVHVIVRYDAPLQRYARILTKDPSITSALVTEVFELVYELNRFKTDPVALRHQLRSYTLKACNHWLRMKVLHNAVKHIKPLC